MGGGLRYFGGAVAFGFAALWIMATLTAALVCVLSAIVGYGVVVGGERLRARRAARAGIPGTPRRFSRPSAIPQAEGLPLWADALNSDLGHIYEPSAATSPLTREAEYGWPLTGGTANPSETLH